MAKYDARLKRLEGKKQRKYEDCIVYIGPMEDGTHIRMHDGKVLTEAEYQEETKGQYVHVLGGQADE